MASGAPNHLLLPAFAALMLATAGCSGSEEVPDSPCGNGVIDGDEVCDGVLLNSSCNELGFNGGNLSCRPDCRSLDVAACGAPMTCGSGQVEAPEVCDGTNLAGSSCEAQQAGAGTLACATNCGSFDLSQCGPSAQCGNGTLDTGEVCDGSNLGGATCVAAGFDAGDLGCAANCRDFDVSGCTQACVPSCDGKQCGDDGCGGSCGECGMGASCETGQCTFCPVVDDVCASGSCVVDIDMPTFPITGEVTLNGSPLPEGASYRLRLVTPGATPESASENYSGGVLRSASYSAQMYPGTYDVFFSLELPGSGGEQLVFGTEPVQQGVTVDGPTTLNVALTSHPVSGSVSFDGAPIPENWTWRMLFVPAGQAPNATIGDHSFSSPTSGLSSYSGYMFPGTYDVYFAVQSTTGDAPGVVWGREPVAQGLSISGPTSLDIALQSEPVRGAMTLNGAALPANWSYRMSFVPQGERLNNANGTHNFGSRAGGSPTYTGQVFAGNYDVYVSLQALTGDRAGLVSGTRLMHTGVAVNGDTAIDIALETHPISGSISYNGAPLAADQRWRLKFVPPGAGSAATEGDHNFGSLDGGPSTYSGNMFPGTYDVYFLENTTSANPATVRGYTLVKSNHVVAGPSTLDVAVVTHPVSGSVSFAGATIPANWDWRLTFVPEGQFPETADGHHFGNISGGAASYAGSVYPGSYDVFFGVQQISGDTTGVVWGTEPIESGVVVAGPTPVNVATDVRPVSGSVSFGGGLVPANWDWRINFVPVGGMAGINDHHFGNVGGGAGQYMGQMYPGIYDVSFRIQQLSGDSAGVVWGARPLKSCVEIR